MARRTFWQHWPAIVLGIGVAAIFLAALVAFEVKETQYAIVMRFGKPKMVTVDGEETVKIYKPGLHARVPFVDQVWKHDNRLQSYELRKGQVEQIQTADDYQIVVTTFVLWRVGDPLRFLRAVNTTEEAQNKLDDVIRSSRNLVLGRHDLTELINTDPGEVRMETIEGEILEDAREVALMKYGIHLEYVGFKHLGFPEKVSTKVFDRMKAERKRKSARYRAEGKRDAQQIRAQADLTASEILAQAEADAKEIRAEGDQKAAEFYSAFRQDPELAAFLRKLDALRKTVSEKTTLVLDTETPPYDLLGADALDLIRQKTRAEEAQTGGAQNDE